MRKTMKGHVLIMMDTDLPMLKSHMARIPLKDGGKDAPKSAIVNHR